MKPNENMNLRPVRRTTNSAVRATRLTQKEIALCKMLLDKMSVEPTSIADELRCVLYMAFQFAYGPGWAGISIPERYMNEAANELGNKSHNRESSTMVDKVRESMKHIGSAGIFSPKETEEPKSLDLSTIRPNLIALNERDTSRKERAWGMLTSGELTIDDLLTLDESYHRIVAEMLRDNLWNSLTDSQKETVQRYLTEEES